uniref:Uncharacterized protein n=1 Tax=Anguilla anguilla TaxID=7936 RepID=A0A0E9UKZ9_ANGAN
MIQNTGLQGVTQQRQRHGLTLYTPQTGFLVT